jgi:zinc and cadmium transporter
VLTHTRLQVYMSFSAGAMLGAAFFHMLPEAVRLGSAGTLRWSSFGLLALFFLERYFAFHHHEAPADPEEPCPTHPHEHARGRGHSAGLVDAGAPGGARAEVKGTSLHWGAAAFGLAAHSLAGGVALASAVAAHDEVRHGVGIGATAWGVFLATVVHKPADALTIVSLMLRAGAPRPWAHLVNLAFGAMIPLGVALFFLGIGRLGPEAAVAWTAAALAFSAGTFLCIALSDLLPELQFHAHDRLKLSLALLSGFALMAATSLAEPHAESSPPVPAGPTAGRHG